MPNITLPDGSVRSFEQSVTISQIAASIGAGLAKAALAGKVDGKLVDTSHRIEADAKLEIVPLRKDPLKVQRFVRAARAAAPVPYHPEGLGPFDWAEAGL